MSDRTARSTSKPARRDRVEAPKGFEPRVVYQAGDPVEVNLKLTKITKTERSWRNQIEKVTGHVIPRDKRVELTETRYWGDPENPMVYCRFKIVERDVKQALDLEDIIKAAKAVRTKPPKPSGKPSGRALVVAWADLQVGKTGSRGGTRELVERVERKLKLLEEHAKLSGCDSAYLVDVGDCVEGFENVAAQAHTNDLSFPEQLRVSRRLLTEATLRLAAIFPEVTVMGVPSNHGAWRRGKGYLGKPGDDFGLEIITTVADAFSLNDNLGHVRFVVPDDWQETLALNLNGTILAVAHGHQVSRPDAFPLWWAKQAHGGQPGADADIMLTGHFHHVRVQSTGRSAHTGRAKWWIQAPTLDNGSDWYRLKSGDDSDPGLLTFSVDANGWSDLRIL